jgi:anaerobic magnesium-protoporphyrin IX monomethyl ester cyclase
MADAVLIYPYFYKHAKDTSIFKFPPLGLGYIASALRNKGFSVDLIDGTFTDPDSVVERTLAADPVVVGYYVMITMEHAALELARRLNGGSRLQVAGGPYPSATPERFLHVFDITCIGEGENTMPELMTAVIEGNDPKGIRGLAYGDNGTVTRTAPRDRITDIDALSTPARDLFDDTAYKDYWHGHYGHTVTSMITSRGCPYHCGFCSKPVFGDSCIGRNATGIVDEMEGIAASGYDRIWIADDCFTLDKKRVIEVCDLIRDRGLNITWECLSRVDGIDLTTLKSMHNAGCDRVFFGLESGTDTMLKKMKKGTDVAAGSRAVGLSLESGLKTGGFFILGYPGETNDTLIKTVNYSSHLGLDYLSYTVPYPIPGTDLYEKVAPVLNDEEWTSPKRHKLLYRSHFSILKLKAAMAKGLIQNWLKRHLMKPGAIMETAFRYVSDRIIRLIP